MKRTEERTAIVFLLVLALAIYCIAAVNHWFNRQYFVVEVVGSSMETTLSDGDLVYADTLAEPVRGDVVIVDVTDNPALNGAHDRARRIIKRVVALAGDRVKCERGIVFLAEAGGEYRALTEPYARGMSAYQDFAEVTVGEGEIFVMGDNRAVSYDSRSVGPLPADDVLGVVPQWSVDAKGPISVWEGFRARLARLFS